MRSFLTFLRKKDLYLGIARYVLGMLMMSFGIMKIRGMQFNELWPTSAWEQSLDHLAGYQLAWAFLGYSNWFQTLLGFFEVVPGVLLLFRRTALLGAVIMLPMTLSVCLINYAVIFWANTERLSLMLVVLNLLILLLEWRKLKMVVVALFARSATLRYVWPEVITGLLCIGLITYGGMQKDFYRKDVNILTGDWEHQHPNQFILLTESVNDSVLPHRVVHAFFGPRHEYSELNDSLNNRSDFKKYTINEQQNFLSISEAEPRPYATCYFLAGDFHYEIHCDSLLLLIQKSSESTVHTWVFKKQVMKRLKLHQSGRED